MSQTRAQLVGGVGFSTADSLTVHNGLAVSGVATAITFDGDVVGNITGVAATFTGNVTVGGGLTVTGISTFNNSTNFRDNITATNITPTVDSNWSLGTQTIRWATVYSDEFIGNVTGGTVAGSTGTFTGVTVGSAVTANSTGIIVVGVVTATEFTGNITGVAATFTGNVTVGGTLTYDDVTNVDSIGVVTARSGIQFGLAGVGGSVSGTGNANFAGIVTATSYYGDGSNLSGVESGVANFVASGTIPNGATVVINTDGTVGVVTSTVSSTPTTSPETAFNTNGDNESISATYDSANGKIIVAYRDGGNSDYGTAIVGTISGNSISFGTPVVFNSGDSTFISATYDSGNGKVVIAYRNVGGNNYGNAIVGTVSGTSISFGSAVEFNSGPTILISSTYDSANGKVVIIGKRLSQGRAYVGTVSGTSISFGSEVVFAAYDLTYTSATYDSANGKVVLAYSQGTTAGRAIVGTVSGTSISFGSEATFNAANTLYIGSAYDSGNGKVVIAFMDGGDSSKGKAIVGTVSGTDISFGSEVDVSGTSYYNTVTYDSANGKVVLAYRDGGNSDYGTAIVGTVSGTSISFGSEVVFNSASTNFLCNAYDPNTQRVFLGYSDSGNSNHGYSVLVSTVTQTTNLTDENYIGIAAEAISNGATGKISIAGGINSGQTGLSTARKHFVLPDGGGVTIGAIFPVVVAGTSISATKIIVKG